MRFRLLWIYLLLPLGCFSQIEISVNSAIRPQPPLSGVLRHYNETRPWLDNQMSEAPLQQGFSLGFVLSEFEETGFWMQGPELTWRRLQTSARGTTPGGEEIRRSVKSVNSHLTLIGSGYTIGLKKGPRIGVSVSIMDFSWWNMRTKLNDEPWEKIRRNGDLFENDILVGSQFRGDLFLPVGKARLHVQAGYQVFWLGENDWAEENKYLNPATYNFHPYEVIKKNSFWAIKAGIIL